MRLIVLFVLIFVVAWPVVAQDPTLNLAGNQAGQRRELLPGMAFRWCPAGKFTMGERDHSVEVTLTKGFWIGETEIRQGQWQKLMETRPWTRGQSGAQPKG